MSTPTTIKDGGPAFPVPDVYHPNGQIEYGSPGMSLRAYFAGKALGSCIEMHQRGFILGGGPTNFAKTAVEIADALIAELNKTQQ